MMQREYFNPVTGNLIQPLEDRHLVEFIAHWDALEALIVRVFRSQEAASADEAEYEQVRAWLGQVYPQYQQALGAFWPLTETSGEPTREDPFACLLAVETARDFVGDWTAMQTLPAAREALNRFLLAARFLRQ